MFFTFKLLTLLWLPLPDLVDGGVLVTYEELRLLNAACHPKDNCAQQRTVDSPGISWPYKCSCNALCTRFGTCCLDSFYNSVQSPKLKPACRKVKLSYAEVAYYMVDRCDNPAFDEAPSCNDKWNGESGVLKLVPVTSLFSSVTYKNYFCFRCHEKTDDFLYWYVWLRSNSTCKERPGVDDVELAYSNDNATWVVTLTKSDVSIAVDLKFDIPSQIWSLPVECEPDVISTCSDGWTDPSVRSKCDSYTAIVHIERKGDRYKQKKYRNVHCALCNFESLNRMSCNSTSVAVDFGTAGLGDYGAFEAASDDKVPFSFTHLLDINRSDGDKVGKIQKCEKGSMWDPFARKCRMLTCALPGHTLRNGKCVSRKSTYNVSESINRS